MRNKQDNIHKSTKQGAWRIVDTIPKINNKNNRDRWNRINNALSLC